MSETPRDPAKPSESIFSAASRSTEAGNSASTEAASTAASGGSAPTHRAGSGHHPFLIAGRVAVAFVAVVVLAVTGWEWVIKSRADAGIISRSVQAIVTDDSNISTATGAPPPAGTYAPENILLLGSDTRSGDNGDETNTDETTSDGVANSDSQMIAHISGDRQHVTVLSIPRDTMIDAPTCNTWDAATGQLSDETYPVSEGDRWHINSAYSVGGPQCSVRAIQDLTGLKIDRVIGIDFAGFKNMVDALGGITVNACGPIIDAELNTVMAQGGVQVIGGEQALNLVRARKVEGDNDSDLSRIRRQQIVLSSILQQVTSAGTLFNPATLDAFLQAFVQNTFTDNVTIDDLVTLAQSFGTLDPSRVTFFTLPTVPSESDPDALDVDEDKAAAVFDALINDQPLPGEPAATSAAVTPPATVAVPESSAKTAVSVDPSTIALTILNLSGRAGVATSTMEQLNEIGFAITDDDLQAPEQDTQSAVTVEYDPSDEANLAAALTVAAAVPGATLVPTDGLDTEVRLLLGEDYDGAVQSVEVGISLTGATGVPNADSPTGESSVASLSEGELASVNAGEALCA